MKKRIIIALLPICMLFSCANKPIEFVTGNNTENIKSENTTTHTSVDMGKIQLNKVIRPMNSDKTEVSSNYLDSIRSFSKDLMGLRDLNNTNAIFSPTSIQTCFSMLLEGANNTSKEELQKVLHIDDLDSFRDDLKNMLLNTSLDTKDGTKLNINQSFWVDDEFKSQMKESYISKLTNDYFAEAFGGILKSDEMHQYLADYINDKTNHFLNVKADDFKDLEGVLWLLNTIYLKCGWQEVFSEYATKECDFTSIDGNKKSMTFLCESYTGTYYSNDDVICVRKYLHDGLYVNFLLPKDKQNAKEILSKPSTVDALLNISSLKNARADISLRLPAFKEQQKIDLKEDFIKLGVPSIFEEWGADLRGIANLNLDENLYVSSAKHEAGIEFTRTGVEAAAYTIISVDKATSAMPEELPKIDFFMDRPFMYAVEDRYGTPLFVGAQTLMK